MTACSRRHFLGQSLALGTAALAATPLGRLAAAEVSVSAGPKFGMVTYQWGQDWDLPTLLENCAKAGLEAVELRTEHKHGVEPSLTAAQRAEVKARLADSPVTLVGLGANQQFDQLDPAAVRQAIEDAKAFVRLSHDVGGSGIKVKPNDLHKEVPVEKTTEQIGLALNELGAFAADYGQQIRLEVHGSCAPLPIMRKILDVATHPNVFVCWNSNQKDLDGEGLEANFRLVQERFGATAHVRPLDTPGYPWGELIRLFVQRPFSGYVLLEAAGRPEGDPVEALRRQRQLFKRMVAEALFR